MAAGSEIQENACFCLFYLVGLNELQNQANYNKKNYTKEMSITIMLPWAYQE